MLSRKILIKKFEQIKKERKFILISLEIEIRIKILNRNKKLNLFKEFENNFWIIIASLNINKFFNKNYFTKILVKSKFINKLNSFYS
jgi:hypothetical protein